MEAKVLDHEPHQALFVPDEDPLLFYRAIAEFGLTHLHPQGLLFFEINEAFRPGNDSPAEADMATGISNYEKIFMAKNEW